MNPPPTEDQHTPLRIEVDANGTPRLYRGKEYLGVASQREVELYASHASLLSACDLFLAVKNANGGFNAYEMDQVEVAIRTAIASARKEQV